mmetsp:Transcript_38701/g.111858  ORF Transcript_38701/g.111858 Transcript_38701/m.111858 type:complete len:309 (-) Transcript_38701:265-1191(-)
MVPVMAPPCRATHMICDVTWHGARTLWPHLAWAMWSLRMTMKFDQRVTTAAMAVPKATGGNPMCTTPRADSRMATRPAATKTAISINNRDKRPARMRKPKSRPPKAATLDDATSKLGKPAVHSCRWSHRPTAMYGEEHSKKTQMKQAAKPTAALPVSSAIRLVAYSRLGPGSERQEPRFGQGGSSEGGAAGSRATAAEAAKTTAVEMARPTAAMAKMSSRERRKARYNMAPNNGAKASPSRKAPGARGNSAEIDAHRFCEMPVPRPLTATEARNSAWGTECLAKAATRPTVTTAIPTKPATATHFWRS